MNGEILTTRPSVFDKIRASVGPPLHTIFIKQRIRTYCFIIGFWFGLSVSGNSLAYSPFFNLGIIIVVCVLWDMYLTDMEKRR